MSFQAYLDAVETKTGLTPRQLVAQATEKGFDDSDVLWLDGKANRP